MSPLHTSLTPRSHRRLSHFQVPPERRKERKPRSFPPRSDSSQANQKFLLALAAGESPWHQAAPSGPPAAPSSTSSCCIHSYPTQDAKAQGTGAAQTQGGAGFIGDQWDIPTLMLGRHQASANKVLVVPSGPGCSRQHHSPPCALLTHTMPCSGFQPQCAESGEMPPA